MLQKYHIQFGNKRTTITVDTILSQLMAIKLDKTPDTPEAKKAVQTWLQDTLVSKLGNDEAKKSASQWARRYLIDEIVATGLAKKWENWRFGE